MKNDRIDLFSSSFLFLFSSTRTENDKIAQRKFADIRSKNEELMNKLRQRERKTSLSFTTGCHLKNIIRLISCIDKRKTKQMIFAYRFEECLSILDNIDEISHKSLCDFK